ncbi:hypothetical protein M407DRAFT_33897 [Tulasnella calospora MUT 4182]|uniref:Uncharacterized protein n=1 Tax=Tulasnella calospora MUT 4182 TaxID=1051891 RepID=A0A0C3Q1K2_9AGAM|nr:hypothetical protein M407DRAFT_33897 [Tulasnella calospora MUT 4182]
MANHTLAGPVSALWTCDTPARSGRFHFLSLNAISRSPPALDAKFLIWQSGHVVPLPPSRIFSGSIPSDSGLLLDLLSTHLPVVERGSSFFHEICALVSPRVMQHQSDFIDALGCWGTIVQCTDYTSDQAWKNQLKPSPITGLSFQNLASDCCSSYTVDIPYRVVEAVPTCVREVDLGIRYYENVPAAKFPLALLETTRRFRLSHPLSSTFNVNPAPRYSIQLVGIRIVFYMTDVFRGTPDDCTELEAAALVEDSIGSTSGNRTWTAFELAPGDALYLPPGSVSFEYCVNDNVTYDCFFIPTSFIHLTIACHKPKHPSPLLLASMQYLIPQLRWEFDQDSNAYLNCGIDVSNLYNQLLAWFESLSPQDPALERELFDLYVTWKKQTVDEIWNAIVKPTATKKLAKAPEAPMIVLEM